MRKLLVLCMMVIMAAVMSVAASAQWPLNSSFVPIVDTSMLQIQVADNAYGDIDSPERWLDVDVQDDGSVILTRPEDSGVMWPHVRTQPGVEQDARPLVDLSETPYLWYDFEVVNSRWNITMQLDGDPVFLAMPIGIAENAFELDGIRSDGHAGEFRGRVNLYDWFRQNQDNQFFAPSIFSATPSVRIDEFAFFVVSPSADGYVRINSLYFGDENQTEPPVVDVLPVITPTPEPTPDYTPTPEVTETPVPAASPLPWVVLGLIGVAIVGCVVVLVRRR